MYLSTSLGLYISIRLSIYANYAFILMCMDPKAHSVCMCVWAEVNLAQQWRALDKEQPDPCLITFRLHIIGIHWVIGVSLCACDECQICLRVGIRTRETHWHTCSTFSPMNICVIYVQAALTYEALPCVYLSVVCRVGGIRDEEVQEKRQLWLNTNKTHSMVKLNVNVE